jgi:mannose-6-phosphate isomerase-like protein (cupin superfamily)
VSAEPAGGSTVAALDPVDTYLHLGEGPEVTLLAGGDAFWTTVDERAELHRGRLVCSFAQDADWTSWEMHPAGDEVVMLLAGAGTLHLDVDDGGGARTVPLAAGQFVVVPKGVWHTMDVHAPGRLLAITWGEGTSHRPRTTG